MHDFKWFVEPVLVLVVFRFVNERPTTERCREWQNRRRRWRLFSSLCRFALHFIYFSFNNLCAECVCVVSMCKHENKGHTQCNRRYAPSRKWTMKEHRTCSRFILYFTCNRSMPVEYQFCVHCCAHFSILFPARSQYASVNRVQFYNDFNEIKTKNETMEFKVNRHHWTNRLLVWIRWWFRQDSFAYKKSKIYFPDAKLSKGKELISVKRSMQKPDVV